jgi:hypothetical protein
MSPDAWEELEEKGAVTHCKDCGKRIWKFWHTADKNKEFPAMELCAPCFFRIESGPLKRLSDAEIVKYALLLPKLIAEFSSQNK